MAIRAPDGANKDVRHFVLCFYILCVIVNDFVSVYRFEAGRGWCKTWLLNKKEIRHFGFLVLSLCVFCSIYFVFLHRIVCLFVDLRLKLRQGGLMQIPVVE